MTPYDAIIVGGSFAGLAVASRLRGNILLINKNEIGTNQTSACGTLLSVVERLGCLDSVHQVYNTGFIHTASRAIEYDLPYALCAFDYHQFCQTLAKAVEAKIVRANVLGLRDGQVITDQGQFEGRCIVDASGWRAVLAGSLQPGFVDRSRMSFGLETITSYREEGLHFWMDPGVIRLGVGWLFPCGPRSRIGVGSYIGETNLGKRLATFLQRFRFQASAIHGGFFPWQLRQPTLGKVFLVGDAAGQCLPLTGEGIRPAIFFGQHCGEIVQRVIDREISLEKGLRQYRELVRPRRSAYTLLMKLQRILPRLSGFWMTKLLALVSYRPLCHFILRAYDGLGPRLVSEARLPGQADKG